MISSSFPLSFKSKASSDYVVLFEEKYMKRKAKIRTNGNNKVIYTASNKQRTPLQKHIKSIVLAITRLSTKIIKMIV